MDSFILYGLAAGLGVALLCGPLGCFIVWRRMAYFGDTLAHSALLGLALGLLLEIDLTLATVVACVGIALTLFLLQTQRRLAQDTLLGIFSHSALAVGMVALSFMESVRIDLMGYLFGNILAVTTTDLIWIYVGGGAALALLLRLWHPLLAVAVNADLATAEGVPAMRVRLLYMLIIALVIAVAMKIIGILLITSLLIIPAATARQWARTPEQMALLATGFGMAAVVGGFWSSIHWDTPTGPSIVVVAALLFATSLLRTLTRDRSAL